MALNIDKLLGWKSEPVIKEYNEKDVMFFGLSLGIGEDPMDKDQLQYVYEKGLKVFPTFPTVLGNPGPWMLNPEFGLNFKMMVHAEQITILYQDMKPKGRIRAITEVTDVIDKGEGKGAMIYLARTIFDDESGEKLANVNGMAFARADGGFGGKTGPVPVPNPIPERAPDFETTIQTLPQQALIYRLNDDMNPLHADPDFALSAKFPKPIIHGMATYSISGRAIEKFCGKFTRLDARFSAPAFPGETLAIEIWQDGKEVSFRVKIAERDAVVLNNGYAIIA